MWGRETVISIFDENELGLHGLQDLRYAENMIYNSDSWLFLGSTLYI